MRRQAVLMLAFLFVFASSASAAVYRWVDQNGTINFADDLSKVPAAYRSSVEEVKAPRVGRSLSQASVEKTSVTSSQRGSGANPPPISQTLVREGDFAISLVEALKMGQAKSEAEAENMLALAGIAPKNGWIADYPVTPDIIGELQNVVVAASDSGKLAVKKDEAMRLFQDLVAQQGLPVRSDERQNPGIEQPEGLPEAGAPPQDYPEYYEPSAIDSYYSDQGPPIVTYYPPPSDYYYMYAWVPYPFWCTGFWFPGFFVLHDFHRGIFFHGHHNFVSNHFRDPRTRAFGAIDPATRHRGNAIANTTHPSRGFTSNRASNGASSIVRRSFEHAGNRPAAIPANRGTSGVSTPRAGASGIRPPIRYRAPSSGYSGSRNTLSSRPTYGASSYRGGFSHPGTGTVRSFSSASRSGSSGFRSGGFGSRGFSGGGGRAFSGGGRGHR